jgi:20S proteasome alpha/beta subunit
MPKKILIIFLICFVSNESQGTVNVLVSTYDGIVVAADSRLTLFDSAMTRIASDSYQKIFRIGNSCGVCCSGTAFLVNSEKQLRNIGSLIEEYKNYSKITDTSIVNPNVIADELAKYLHGFYIQMKSNFEQGQLELLVFGYDTFKKRHLIEITLPILIKNNDSTITLSYNIQEFSKSGVPCSKVKGQQDVYSRLIKGYDASLLDRPYYSNIKSDLDKLRYDIRYELMSLQDAVDFATFIVRATIESQRFNQKSVMGVGGDIDIALVTPDGFKWLRLKKFKVEGIAIQ